ncbi:Major latex protein domain containing protein [Parasponia andersonii]|uniref:Major latex protein domain containing protein n=1 Tax=Parasponia andersonii TaxID=3476 RepID=A0A2P5BIM8_PARAD|nr:Major latex protein domain containing protein [Parasponia andersonii]
MANLKGTVETEIEIKASPEKLYNMFTKTAHRVPNAAGNHVKGVEVHEGKGGVRRRDEDSKAGWDWKEMCSEYYKSFTPVYHLISKSEGSLVESSIEYEKLSEDVPVPDKYLVMSINMAGDIDEHLSKADQ